MMRAVVKQVLGFLAGVGIAAILAPAALHAQSAQDGTQAHPYVITQTGGWNLPVQCDTPPASMTIAIDTGAAAPLTPTWTGTGPFTANLPLAQLPAAVRVPGIHQVIVAFPATIRSLVDGSTYTYPAGSASSWVEVLPDLPPSNVPRLLKWIKILGTAIAASIAGL